ncbi:MFS transporter [Arthrobacter sp. NPDC080031]|uniref:MFS transporter n=1 Tax=Arthrobacter sp. NPDC080031 TaxID=3155918 RepID=UPI00344DB069
MGVGPLLIYGLSATSSLVIDSLKITPGQFGLLAAVCFLAAGVSSGMFGRFSDRMRGGTQICLIFGGAAAAMMLVAVSGNFLWLVLAVVLSGAAQALSNPATNRLVMDHVPAHKRAGWIGVKQSGVQGSQFLAGIAFPAVALVTGWRGVAGLSCALALVLLVVAWRSIPTSAGPAVLNSRRTSAPSEDTVLGGTAASPKVAGTGQGERGRLPGTVWAYAAYALLSGFGIQATNVYLPLFSQREVGFPLVLGGLTAAVAGVIGVVSRIVWGQRIMEKGSPFTLLLTLGLGAAAGAALLLAAGLTQSAVLLWCGVLLHGAMGLAINVVVMAGLMRDAPPGKVGAASGRVAVGLYLGFAAGPLAVGGLLTAFNGFMAGWCVVIGVYLACGLLAAITRHRMPGSPQSWSHTILDKADAPQAAP